MQKNDEKKNSLHPATNGGHHFIFSPENPVAEPKIKRSPEDILSMVRSWGETVEDVHGHYGSPERSFIIHDPKNIDKLHNLVANLGQESSIHSNGGNHEMHYYHGPNANKVRTGKGTQVFENKPEDFYTKVTNHNGEHSFFSHNFDWSPRGLKDKINKKETSNAIYEAICKGNVERFNFQEYWNLVLGDHNNTLLSKSLKIRTEGRVFVSMDGDNIGASVQRAAMADDLETIINQSNIISEGQKLVRQWAKSKDADIYLDGGDDISFTLPKDCVDDLDDLRRAYKSKTGFTVTIGLGDTISRAGHAMLYGKVKGKNQVNEWSPEIDKKLKEISQDLTPEEKLADHGLIGDKIPGGLADKKSKKDFDQKQLKVGIKIESEHTSDPAIAEEIAMDHLTEDKDYYKKLQELEKAVAPPKKPGEVSPDGRYVSKHHRGAGVQAWHYNPQLAADYDSFIDKNKQSFVAKHPPEHQQVVSDFIDSVRGDFNRHFVIGKDQRGGTEKIRARHLRGLMRGDSNYEIKVHGPDRLSFVAHERHGSQPNKSSVWNFNIKKPQVNTGSADKGYKTATGGHYVSKSEGNSVVSSSGWSRNRSLENDQRAVYGISELVQYRRYNGVSKGSPSLIKASQDDKKIGLVHYSKHPELDSIDPAHMGSGIGSRGRESKYGRPGVERSYFYKEGTDPEPMVVSASKARYISSLEPYQSIYDIGSDPDGIYKKLKESGKTMNPGIVTSDEYLQAVKDAGHHGFHNPSSQLPNVVALFYKHPVKEDKTFNKSEENLNFIKNEDLNEESVMRSGKVIYDKINGWDLDALHKSKNVREQRKKVFGTSSSPSPKSKQREKQMRHIQEKLTDRYQGKVPVRKTPGKLNAQGKFIDKPNWKTGYLEYQDNPDAAIHEAGHFEQIPEGSTMEEHQGYMDRRFGEINRDYGYLKAKQTQDEIQPQAAENPIRRRLGLPANTTEVYITEPGQKRGRRPEPGEEIPRAVDTGDLMAVRGKKGGKEVFLRRQSRLLSDENRERMERIDTGELVYDPDLGWVEGTSPDARINQKARLGAKEYFKRRLKQIREEKERQMEEEPLASSFDEKIKKLKEKYSPKQETSIDGRVRQIKEQFKAKQDELKNKPMKTKIAQQSMQKNDEDIPNWKVKVKRIKTQEPQQKNIPDIDITPKKTKTVTKQPTSAPSLDYSKMKAPKPPSAVEQSKQARKAKAIANAQKAREELSQWKADKEKQQAGAPKVPKEEKPSATNKMLNYFKTKLKKP